MITDFLFYRQTIKKIKNKKNHNNLDCIVRSKDLTGDVLAATVPAFDLQGATFNQVDLFSATLKLSDFILSLAGY